MKPGKLFWGVLFLTLGVLFLIKNISSSPVINYDFFRLWPLIFVLFGAAYLVTNINLKYASFGAAGLIAALCIFTFKIGPFHWFGTHSSRHYDYQGKAYEEQLHPEIKKVFFTLDGGAGEFMVAKTDSSFFKIVPQDSSSEFSFDKKVDGDVMRVKVRNANEDIHIDSRDGFKYGLKVLLNTAPHYDLTFHTGASSNNYDLTGLIIEKLKMECGASSTVLKLGELKDTDSKIFIDAGASSFQLLLPKGTAAKIKTSTALSSTNISGMIKIDDELFQTDNYSSAPFKYDIVVDGGVMSLDVNQY